MMDKTGFVKLVNDLGQMFTDFERYSDHFNTQKIQIGGREVGKIDPSLAHMAGVFHALFNEFKGWKEEIKKDLQQPQDFIVKQQEELNNERAIRISFQTILFKCHKILNDYRGKNYRRNIALEEVPDDIEALIEYLKTKKLS